MHVKFIVIHESRENYLTKECELGYIMNRCHIDLNTSTHNNQITKAK